MSHISKKDKISALYELLAGIDSAEDMGALFEDMCTAKEIQNMAERVLAARLLMEGKTYSQIIAQSDISSATLSRVSRCVQFGNGYSRLLGKEDDEDSPSGESLP